MSKNSQPTQQECQLKTSKQIVNPEMSMYNNSPDRNLFFRDFTSSRFI